MYVWNPQTHRREVMAVWNETTQSYETPADPTEGASEPSYSFDYQWNEESGQYDYVMVHKHGN